MSDEPSTILDDQLLPLLLACDNALAGGTVRQEPPADEPPSALRQRLEDDLACIQLLRQVLPRPVTPKEKETDAAPSLPLRQLGRFVIHRELGQGAFGMVFLATDTQLGRAVALKIPRPEALLTAELRERFLREARAAASLDHPNLVPVYEAGSEGPLCYIASAYCPGITLAQWLAQRSEAVPVRLAAWLVATLAQAVEHAHQRGVVHRDLKPSNVLLQGRHQGHQAATPSTVQEAEADSPPAELHFDYVPRLTDFGLAKLTAEAPNGEAWTQTGAVLGTPNYMAPEQASGKNKEIGPAADVYALGAILYELLTGRPPFLGETVLETLEQVRTREPLPPSRLRPKLPRDVETICLKCLAKEPHKRYASARALAEDLNRYLMGVPIAARPIGRLERTVKWARRKPAQAMLLGMVLALIVVVLGYTVKLRLTIAEKEQQRQEAIRYFQWARQSNDDFATKLSQDKRLLPHNLEGMRKEYLQAALDFNQKLAAHRPDDPDMRGEWAQAILRLAMLRKEMGDQQQAIEDLQSAITILKQLVQEHPNQPQCQQWLAKGLMNLGATYMDQRKPNLAEDVFGEARNILQRLVAEYPEVPEYQDRLAGSVSNLGMVYEQTGRSKLAKAAYEEARDRWVTLAQVYPQVESYRRNLAMSHFNLGMVCFLTSQMKQAEESFSKSCDLRRQLAMDHPDIPDYQDDLADSLQHTGMASSRAEVEVKFYHEAEKIYQKLVDNHPKLPNYRDSLARVHHNLGSAFERLRQPKQAEDAYNKSCTLREQLVRDFPKLPDYQFDLSATQYNLALLYRRDGRLKQARTLLSKVLETQKKLVEDYPSILRFRVHLGKTYCGLGMLDLIQNELQSALDRFDQAVLMQETVLKKEPKQTEALSSLNDVYQLRTELLSRLERYADALRDLDRLRELAGGEKSDSWVLLRAVILARMGQYSSAMTEAGVLFDRASMPPIMYYNLACLCSLCSAAVHRDKTLAKAEQDHRSEQYAARAVEYLKKAKAAGFFKPAAAMEEMRKDKDLDALRERPDFQELFPQAKPKNRPKDTP